MRKTYPLLLVLLLLTGCAGTSIQRKDGTTSNRAFSVAHLAKTDADILSELTQREVLNGLRTLTEKLYRRNPQEYRKVGLESVEAASARLFEQVAKWQHSPLARADWQDGFRQAFQENFEGDRVYAFMGALTSMLMAAYNHKTEFFLPDDLSAQKLYNSARNIEVAVWKLSSARTGQGGRFLLSNSMEGETQNLSFEREFGKLIAQQDLLALYMEERSHRTISRVFQSMTSFVFLPI
ncbi:MAG: hypothetical protein MUE86_00480 [Thiobacillaceae bacterium]|jgi:hypothetical protein|nr:hypothetical protein [Thiobacillaceae bacterium]